MDLKEVREKITGKIIKDIEEWTSEGEEGFVLSFTDGTSITVRTEESTPYHGGYEITDGIAEST